MTLRRCSSLLTALALALALAACSSDIGDRLQASESSPEEPEPEPEAVDVVSADGGFGGARPVVQFDSGAAGSAAGSEPEVSACSPGTFVSGSKDAPACTGCPSGTFSPEENAEECMPWTECPPAEFVADRGTARRDQTCEACPEGYTSAAANAGTCVPVGSCPGGTVLVMGEGDEAGVCEECEAGNFCPGGASAAQPCPAGAWDHDEDAATDCVEQTNCAPGEFVKHAGSATSDRECTPCDGGTFSLEGNAFECTAWTTCGAGSFVAEAGTFAHDQTCDGCPSGTFTEVDGQTECSSWTECQPGEFVVSAGSAVLDQACEPCALGTFSVNANADSCTPDGECPAGTHQTAAGTADSPAQCEDCDEGEFCAGGDTPSEPCATGTWDHDEDPATACAAHTECLAGSYVQRAGTNRLDRLCAPCPSGTFSTDPNVATCQPWQNCSAGTFVQAAGSATSNVVCAGCASGTYSSASNAQSCVVWTDCQPGQYVLNPGTDTGDRLCTSCPSGQYSAGINAGSCVDADACPQGTVETAPATQSSPAECDACSAGTYCAGGAAQAVACSASTWDDDADPGTPCVSKTVCAAGKYVLSAGSTTTDRTCANCAAGHYSTTQNATSCTAWSTCAAGNYVQSAGTNTSNRVCAACASGFSTTQNAASCTAWSVCEAPSYYMTAAPTATSNRVCAACTAPAVTSDDNATSCAVPAFQMSSGQVVMEAENYTTNTASGDSWSSASISGISGNTAMVVGPDNGSFWTDYTTAPSTAPRLVYYVNFTSTGSFNIYVRGDDPLSVSSADSCWAGLDGAIINGSTFFDFPDPANTWGWVSQSLTVSSTGVHTITIYAREDGFRMDKIVITNGSAPTGNGPAESPRN